MPLGTRLRRHRSSNFNRWSKRRIGGAGKVMKISDKKPTWCDWPNWEGHQMRPGNVPGLEDFLYLNCQSLRMSSTVSRFSRLSICFLRRLKVSCFHFEFD